MVNWIFLFCTLQTLLEIESSEDEGVQRDVKSPDDKSDTDLEDVERPKKTKQTYVSPDSDNEETANVFVIDKRGTQQNSFFESLRRNKKKVAVF